MGRFAIRFGFQVGATLPQRTEQGYYLDSCPQENFKETGSCLMSRRCGLNCSVLCETIEGKQPVYYLVIVICASSNMISKNQYKLTQHKN